MEVGNVSFAKRVVAFLFAFFCINLAIGQKTIELNYINSGKRERTYNMDCAEIYLIANRDTIFIPKVGKYGFLTNAGIDSLAAQEPSGDIFFLVRTHRYSYLVKAAKELYVTGSWFKFHFYYTRDNGSWGAVTYPSGVSSNARAVIVPNKGWKKKFSPHLR